MRVGKIKHIAFIGWSIFTKGLFLLMSLAFAGSIHFKKSSHSAGSFSGNLISLCSLSIIPELSMASSTGEAAAKMIPLHSNSLADSSFPTTTFTSGFWLRTPNPSLEVLASGHYMIFSGTVLVLKVERRMTLRHLTSKRIPPRGYELNSTFHLS